MMPFVPRTDTPACCCPSVPTPTVALSARPCEGARVKIWITPPTASGPYSAEAAPRRISIRSMRSSGMFSSEAPPEVAEPTRRPSISTRV